MKEKAKASRAADLQKLETELHDTLASSKAQSHSFFEFAEAGRSLKKGTWHFDTRITLAVACIALSACAGQQQKVFEQPKNVSPTVSKLSEFVKILWRVGAPTGRRGLMRTRQRRTGYAIYKRRSYNGFSGLGLLR